MGGFRFLTAALAVVLASPSDAAELKIVGVKAYAFLQQTGKLSDDLVGADPITDAPRGGAPGGESATGLLLDFTFEGDKNVAPKYATATVDLTQTRSGGQQVITHKAFSHFQFGPDGLEHRAIFLEGATCMPLDIDVRAGKTKKSVKLEFSCAESAASN